MKHRKPARWWRPQVLTSRRNVLIVITLFAVAGLVMLLRANAATNPVAVEAESGILAGQATTIADIKASRGSAVKFRHIANYVALGDSVASGEGINYGWQWNAGDGSWGQAGSNNPVWEPSTDLTPAVQACHRSLLGYPTLVANATGDKLYNPSCSGASIEAGILGSISRDSGTVGLAQLGAASGSPAPANALYDSFKPDVVSITIGMDDINFTSILENCYLHDCDTTSNDQTIDTRIATFKTNLSTLLQEVKTRGTTAGKVPTVILTTYYDPLPADAATTCGDLDLLLGFGINSQEVTWLRQKLQLLNQAITAASTSYPKVKVVNLSNALAGHTLCTADPWVYGVSIWYDDFGNPAPLHPTPAGQQAIADLITPAMKGL